MTISLLSFNSKLIVLLLLVAISMPLLEEARPLGTRVFSLLITVLIIFFVGKQEG